MIRPCRDDEFETVYEIVNDAAEAYRSAIPADRWKEPYMPREELRHEMDSGVVFWGYERTAGYWRDGVQDLGEVTLIRHASSHDERRKGLGRKLLRAHLEKIETPPSSGRGPARPGPFVYEKHGFRLVTPAEKDRLLRATGRSRRQVGRPSCWATPGGSNRPSASKKSSRHIAAGSRQFAFHTATPPAHSVAGRWNACRRLDGPASPAGQPRGFVFPNRIDSQSIPSTGRYYE